MDSREPPPVPPRPPEIVVRQDSDCVQSQAASTVAQPPLAAKAVSQHDNAHAQLRQAAASTSRTMSTRYDALERMQTGPMTTFSAPVDVSEHCVDDADHASLPSYAQLRESEPGNPRFGRWRGWVEKRARERGSESNDGQKGGTPKKSWDLDGSAPPPESSDDAQAAARRKKQDLIEQRMSRQAFVPVNSEPMSKSDDEGAATDSSSAQPSVTSGRSEDLTHTATIRPLGSRFASGLPVEPLCACVLPLGGRQGLGLHMER
ncbi:hypothetical protein ACM66B_000589 [Microbotryomycetes sp. NB124-2]